MNVNFDVKEYVPKSCIDWLWNWFFQNAFVSDVLNTHVKISFLKEDLILDCR